MKRNVTLKAGEEADQNKGSEISELAALLRIGELHLRADC